MVEEQLSEGPSDQSVIGWVAEKLTDAFFAVGEFLTSDRAMNGFFRQGLDELGTAFGKALPDSIQIDESGTLWNPTQGEIARAANGNAWGYDGPTPGEIAASNQPYDAGQDRGQDYGQDLGHGY